MDEAVFQALDMYNIYLFSLLNNFTGRHYFIFYIYFQKILFIYFPKRERAQAGEVARRRRSRLPEKQGAQHGILSQDPGIITELDTGA